VPTQVFRDKPIQGRLAPTITMGIALGEVWYPIGVYVDSGAAYTLLHAAVAQGADFGYRTGHLMYLQVGDGSFIPVRMHDLELQIGPERFLAKIGGSGTIGGGVQLAWAGKYLAHFQICFQESQRVLTFAT
jgi:hypothetical protein